MDNKQKYIELLKDPKYYIESFCKIKSKQGGIIPFKLNEAQKDLYNTLKKSSRLIILKARQIGFCLDKDTNILSRDLKWIKLSDVKVGQEIISVDENHSGGKGAYRAMKNAVVEAKWSVFEEAFRLKLDNGEEVIATGQHRFLCKARHVSRWVKVHDMKIGTEIRYITTTWGEPGYQDGWLAGIIDGEGHLSKPARTGAQLTISQTEGPVLDRIKKELENNSIPFRIEWDRRLPGDNSKLGAKEVCKVVVGTTKDLFKVMGKFRPSRFQSREWWVGKKMPCDGWAKIVSIESLGKREMIDLQTSEKTFIANGLVSHNSSAVTGYFYHRTIMNPGVNTALIGYNSDLTTELLDKVKTFYRTTPDDLRPTIHYNSKFEISFPKIDSKILVLPSTENVGRGYTLHNVLLTELAFWEKPEEKMMALENSVPLNGKIVIESTPAGAGNLYHRMWMSDNDYVKKEYGWWWIYTEEEIETIRRRMNNPQKFAQEYELEFLSSGRPVFDAYVVKKQRKNELSVGDKVMTKDGEHLVSVVSGLRIYKPPERGGFYVLGADVSEGVTGGDYSTLCIWDRKTGEEVAFFRGHLAPDKFAEKINEWGRKYNNALAVVEVNNHGLTTLTVLKQLLYPSIYFRPSKFDTVASGWSEKLGWKTTRLTRPLLIDDFGQALREGVLTIHSKELLDEMTVFVYDNSNDMQPQHGFHDDCIFAAAIGYQGFKVMYDKPLTQINYSNHMPDGFAY